MAFADSNTLLSNNVEGFCAGYNYQNCSNNVIAGNKIISTTRSWLGVELGSGFFNNTFSANTVSGFSQGIGYFAGPENLLSYHQYPNNNSFYQNNIFDNFFNNIVYFSLSNPWDNGKVGNYYDNYNGSDTNNDGIGDTPYVINGNNVDHYPLMSHFNISEICFEFRGFDWFRF